MSDDRKHVAALTPATGYWHYPPYLNASCAKSDPNRITVRLRGDEGTGIGAEAVATFTRADFALFLLEASKNLTD